MGEFETQRTHKLTLLEHHESDSLSDRDYADGEGDDKGKKIRDFDFTDKTVFNDVMLTRISSDGVIRYSPVAVVYTSKKIVDGHSDITKPEFRRFLSTYIAYVEGKRFLWRYRENEEQKRSGGDVKPAEQEQR